MEQLINKKLFWFWGVYTVIKTVFTQKNKLYGLIVPKHTSAVLLVILAVALQLE